MTLGLKFLLCINGKIFDSKKTPFRCILVRLWVKVFVSQGWLQAEIAVPTL